MLSEGLSSTGVDRAFELAVDIAFFDVFSFIVGLFPLPQGQFDFHKTALVKINFGRNENKPFLGHRADQPLDLAFFKKQFPFAVRIFIQITGLEVGINVQIIKEYFIAFDPGVTVGKIDLAGADGLDLPAMQDDPAFPILGQMKIVIGFFIGGDGFHIR